MGKLFQTGWQRKPRGASPAEAMPEIEKKSNDAGHDEADHAVKIQTVMVAPVQAQADTATKGVLVADEIALNHAVETNATHVVVV